MQKEKIRIPTLTREQKEKLLEGVLSGKSSLAECPQTIDMLMRDLRGARLPNESWIDYFINEKLGFHSDPRLWQMLGVFIGFSLTIGISFTCFAVARMFIG